MNLSEAVRLERDKRKRQAFIRREQDILSVCESLMAEKGVRQVSDWIEAQLYAPRRSLLIHELVATLKDDSEALNKIQDTRYQMRKRLAQVLSGSSSTRGRPFERAMWLDAIVQGALMEMESALKSESFDEDDWVESITRIVPILMSQSKLKFKKQDLTYL